MVRTVGAAGLRIRCNVASPNTSRAAHDVRTPPLAHTIVLYDGVCGFCNAGVRTVIRLDRRARFRFAALGSQAAAIVLERVGAPHALPESVIVIDERGLHARSAAVLAIARGLGVPWSWAAVFAVVPRAWRDALYDMVAKRRRRLFTTLSACPVPPAHVRERFLDADERAATTA